MKSIGRTLISLIFLISLGPLTPAQERVDWEVIQRIREEGFTNSHLMEDFSFLTDVYGPRLAKSPSYLAAAKWTKKKFEEYGLENVALDPYEFGVGWRNDYTSVHMMKPQYMPLIAYPQSWSAETKGKVHGPVVFINFEEITSIEDLSPYKGKLKETIIFTSPKRVLTPSFIPDAVILSEEQLDKMAQTAMLPLQPAKMDRYPKNGRLLRNRIIDFLLSEGAAAVVSPDQVYDDGTVMVTKVAGTPWAKDAPNSPPELVMAVEHYNRLMRILEKGIPVEMEIEIRVSLFDDDLMDYNVIAEIPGSDLADQVVMLGAHLDAHAGGTGAEDNATGAAQVIEAARILKAIGVKPRRKIRFVLWGGEETGHVGSRAYIRKHFFDPRTNSFSPEHDKFSCYFNLDYGTGRIRGIYLMNNFVVRPIFSEWMKPFRDLGMTHLILVPGQDIGSDHDEFEAVGLPAFPFLQDPVENDSRTFHSNMDVYDRIVPEYLIQGAVIVASFVYQAAMRKERIPRKSNDQ